MLKCVVPGLLMVTNFCGTAHSQDAPQLQVLSEFALHVERSFGSIAADPFSTIMLMQNENRSQPQISLGFPDEQLFTIPTQKFLPRPIISGYPLIQTKGVVRGGDYLYVSDTGKDGSHQEEARIWRLDPSSGELIKFFSGDLLVNSKWLHYLEAGPSGGAELVISDYGEESVPRQPGTGVGAKVFALPINGDGTAGEPRVLHDGPPLRSPEGVTIIGNTVIIADWAAGDEASRSDAPNVRYKHGVLYGIPLSGGMPEVLFPDEEWVVLIGASVHQYNSKSYLRLIDLDGGRYDQSELAALPQSGTPGYFQAEILSAEPLLLGELVRVPLTEVTPITMALENFPDGELVFTPTGGTKLEDGDGQTTVTSADIDPKGQFSILLSSGLDAPSVSFDVELVSPSGGRIPLDEIVVPKQIQLGAVGPMDPKKEAAMPSLESGDPLVFASADGTTASVYLAAQNGGTPANLWRGAPLINPMGVEFSADGRSLYVADQSAGDNSTSVIWEFVIPTSTEILQMFPNATLEK